MKTAATEVTGNFLVNFGHDYGWCIGIVSVCLVLCGWRVTYKNSVKVATRSESKALIDAITKVINDISDSSLTYWLKTTNKKTASNSRHKICAFKRRQTNINTESVSFLMNLLAKSNQVYKLIEILQTRGITIETLLISNVIEKATLDCETVDDFSRGDRAQRAQEVVDSCMEVIKSLYDEFQQKYPPINNEGIISKFGNAYKQIDDWHKDLN